MVLAATGGSNVASVNAVTTVRDITPSRIVVALEILFIAVSQTWPVSRGRSRGWVGCHICC